MTNSNGFFQYQSLFNIMHKLDIHDNWRIQNTDVHCFSWRGPEGKQSRLDYYLVFDNLWKSYHLPNWFQYRMNINCTDLILLV
jgi:hypothetical protein